MNTKQLFLGVLLFIGTVAYAAPEPKEVKVALDKAYVPIGFDDNDRVQIMVTGSFPNTCYKVDSVRAEVNAETKSIRVWQSALLYSGDCLPIVVPFSQVVNVGLVKEGDYSLWDGASGAALGKLPVLRSAHSGPDDFLYAPIKDAIVMVDEAGAKSLKLVGEFSDRCTEIEEIKIHYYPEVIVVQPTARRTGERCALQKTRFMKVVELEPALKGTFLLHVRSMEGQAINKLVDVNFAE